MTHRNNGTFQGHPIVNEAQGLILPGGVSQREKDIATIKDLKDMLEVSRLTARTLGAMFDWIEEVDPDLHKRCLIHHGIEPDPTLPADTMPRASDAQPE